MRYVTISSPAIVTEHIASTLIDHLERGEHVAWLLGGGSAIQLEVGVAKVLRPHDTSRLFILLADERYGPPGHVDENYTLLMNAGFSLPISRVLTGVAAIETTKAFGAQIDRTLDKVDFSLGIFGIGADGHTAGIKPHSPAVTSTETALFYPWDDYQRITITPGTVLRLDEAIIYALGSEKADTLRRLVHETIPLEDQPAQVLKAVKTSTLYTDNTL